MIIMTKGMVGFAALIASGLAVAQFIPASPAATDQNFFQTDTKADDFALRQRAREALQTLIERRQSNERQQSALRIL